MGAIKKAASLTKGKTASQKVKAVCKWVVAKINYDRKKNPPAGCIAQHHADLQFQKGICYDFASLFAAMLRSQGVPTKLVKGYADKVSGYHAWNEVYVNGKWQTIDTSYDAQVGGSMYKNRAITKRAKAETMPTVCIGFHSRLKRRNGAVSFLAYRFLKTAAKPFPKNPYGA